VLINEEGFAVDTPAELIHLIGRKVVRGHEFLVCVATTAGRRNVANRNRAVGLPPRKDPVHTMAIGANGHVRIALRQQQAVLRGQILGVLIGRKTERLHAVRICMARGAQSRNLRAEGLPDVLLLEGMRFDSQNRRIPPMAHGAAELLPVHARLILDSNVGMARAARLLCPSLKGQQHQQTGKGAQNPYRHG
jgi:hypothetical protein